MKIVIQETNGEVSATVESETKPELIDVLLVLHYTCLDLIKKIKARNRLEEKKLIEVPTGPMLNGLKVV